MKEKPDMAFFTGDLVNDRAYEVKDYIDIFSKVKAPLGVHSTFGNHDYGDYSAFNSPAAKVKNLKDLATAHKQMGWNLMLDENRPIRVDGAEIGIIGIQNWGVGFCQARQLGQSVPGRGGVSGQDSAFARSQPLERTGTAQFQDIDLALAGHTHGMQFGVELPGFKWSPAQYRYEHWAGLYQEENQYLYVNRGFGYIGYPGRVGILPEITILELVRA